MELPEIDQAIWDKYKIPSPVSKMPNCPNCEEDELGLLQKDAAFCYRCGLWFERQGS